MTDLYPLLHQSLNWYHLLREISVEERLCSKVRSTEQETGLSSSDKPVEMEVDIVALKPLSSKPSSSKPPFSSKARAFHALKESCNLDENTFF